jgi:phosphonate transport system permease protein
MTLPHHVSGMLAQKRLRAYSACALGAVLFAAMSIHLVGFETDWSRMGSIGEIISTVASFLPNLSFLSDVAYPLFETVLMAFWGTLLGAVFSIPISYLSAANVTPSRFIAYPLGRACIIVFRSTHEIIFALIFVAALGLGPLAGIFALGTRCIGFMSKTTAEAIENVKVGPIEAIAATGANPLTRFEYAIIPQILPVFLGNIIFQLDINVRRAAILGMVGAGGIGLTFSQEMQNYNYANAGTCILAITIIVVLGEVISNRVRTRIFTGE